jgi:nitrogenase molybdenum-iron protein alpha/beta subunit
VNVSEPEDLDLDLALEEFSLKGMNYARMTGAAVASHAISDSFLLMHCGVGCKYKTAAQGAIHDLGEHPNTREAWTQVAEQHLISGCAARIGPFARAWWERRHSKLMVVTSAYFIELTGDDIKAELEQVEQTLPDCHMVYVNTAAPNKGFYDGYAAVLREIVQRMDWSVPSNPRKAAVHGFFFHRHENDMKADVGQLRALVKACGLEPGAILLSGEGYEGLRAAPEAGVQILMPYVKPHDRKIRRTVGKARKVVQVDLPMGFGGTRRFCLTIAQEAGTYTPKLDAWIDQQEAAVNASLAPFRERLRQLSVAVFCDTPHAAGLVTLLHELGVSVPLVGLRDQDGSLGGRTAFFDAVSRNGVHEVDKIEVLEDPSLRLVTSRLREHATQGRIMGMISSTHERRAVDADPIFDAVFARFETGYPADGYHAVLRLSSLGHMGVATWAQRLMDRFWEQRAEPG